MIPVTYPSVLTGSNLRQVVIYILTDVTGLKEWVDYIPVKAPPNEALTALADTFANEGFLYSTTITDITGLVAYKDYIPVYVTTAGTTPWSTSTNGYIPLAGIAPTDPYYSNVTLLLHMNGTNNSTTFTDNSPSPKTVTATGDAKLSTAQPKFGTASAVFDGTNDYLTVTNSADTLVTTGDITIEFWSYITTLNDGSFYSNFTANMSGHNVLLYYSTGTIRWYYNGNATIVSAAGVIKANQMQHIAVVKKQGTPATFKIYVDGIEVASATGTQTTFGASAVAFRIGNALYSAATMNGYIDEFRVTRGVARYTANFTPPSSAFQNS